MAVSLCRYSMMTTAGRRIPYADDLVEEDVGTERMLKEERGLGLLRHSSKRSSNRSIIVSMYEEKAKICTADDKGHKIHWARLTPTSIIDKNDDFWSRVAELQKLEVEDGKVFMDTLRKRFGDMVKLESLSMVWTTMKALPSSCFKLPLKTLVLQRNQMHSLKGVEIVATLEFLDVSNNSLRKLPKSFGNLTDLRVLNLCGNKLKNLPDSIGMLKNLEMFNCSSNRLISLPDSLTGLTKLINLDISGNHIDQLPENFGNLTNLTDVRCTGNQLPSLPNSFAKLNRLTSLLLGNNKFLFVPMELAALEHLENLNLRDNYISSMDCALISVRVLVLDFNRLTAICDGICHSTNLEVLSLVKNLVKSVPSGIENLTKLRLLQLNGNPLSEFSQETFQQLELRKVKIRLQGTKFGKQPEPQTAAAGNSNQSDQPDSDQSSQQNQCADQSGQQNQTSDQSGKQIQTSDQPGQQNQTSDQPGQQNQTSDQPGKQNQTPDQPGKQNQTPDQSGQPIQNSGLPTVQISSVHSENQSTSRLSQKFEQSGGVKSDLSQSGQPTTKL